ncbi:TetR/AcrR family transcriptional regulator [Parashewanella curva]|uniref:TetR/AcrR family transcriptional regulator n=1 Tax=Parashewanella curva TaxID=2338552 RepID=A0A3L8Q1F9_9GAMM|nr:TetR/AcrR family transcriptional regulator [Parashewanella curva]RLV60668.1 TetR/AcrR family transcriptional regulator [Parashewanella curva]
MASVKGTKTKILNAAEKLFAERGFSETSLRLITSKAEVNLASVNYHFGSKKELIRAVLARYLDVFMPAAVASLEQLPDESSLEDVFSSLVNPLLELKRIHPYGTSNFLQLISRGYIESQGHLRWFFTTHYGDSLSIFIDAVKSCVPDIPDSDMFWKLHFTLGTVVFTMASSDALMEIAAADFEEHNDIETVIRKLIPYMASGVTNS